MMWARNLTPDRETGLGAGLARRSRARSGAASRRGAAAPPQASIWDHASNWDEEDVRALIAFLRVLLSVRRSNTAT
jgi:hypothetical protein